MVFIQQQIMIDFGLSFTSSLAEDKAVDLQVFQKQIKVFLLATKGDDDTLATFYNTWRARKDTKLQIYVEYTKWVFEPGH